MGIEDRDWLKKDRERREKLVWNDKTGEMEFDRARTRRRWRWPYRLRRDLPWWVREIVRQAPFWAGIALLYLAWTRLR